MFPPGSAAAPAAFLPQSGRGHTEGGPGSGRLEPQRCVELAAALGASHCAQTCQDPTSSPPGPKESSAGLSLCPVSGCAHQHPQCSHRPGQEPGHEDQGCSQRRADGTNRQEMTSMQRGDVTGGHDYVLL